MNRSLRELFFERVIRIPAVQCERVAALEEVLWVEELDRWVVPEDLEWFFDHGFMPDFDFHGGARRTRTPLWEISTESIDPRELEQVAQLISPALMRAVAAAVAAWSQLIRDLRYGRLIATGEKLGPVMTVYHDRDEIGPETWLSEGLLFDVRNGAICVLRPPLGFGPDRAVKLWVDITVREAADSPEPSQTEEPSSDDTAPSPAETPDEDNLEHQMIRNILAKAFPGHGPDYAGIAPKDQLKAVRDGWNAECEAQEMQHLIRRPPDRWKVGRASRRYRPR